MHLLCILLIYILCGILTGECVKGDEWLFKRRVPPLSVGSKSRLEVIITRYWLIPEGTVHHPCWVSVG